MRSLFALLLPVCLFGSDGGDHFETHVRPLFAKMCLGCHGATKMGGLEMRNRDSLLKGGNSGPAVVPGDPQSSLLMRVIEHRHERIKMPPPPQAQIGEAERAEIARWIKDGAVWPEHKPIKKVVDFWSLKPVRMPALPKAPGRTAIDKFIGAKLQEKGLRQNAPADRRTLLRRATYDLTGLPPTAAEIDAFVADQSPDAYAKVIDRLLASPRYGERWGRHWLDVARYSDDKLDPTGKTPHPNAFRYRDWVIDAFNRDMPYDVFVKAQLAGDQMPEPEKYAAGLGLFALSPEFQDDRVDVTTRGFLGFTVACAQCHDHKFDPIPQKDYYALLGVFNNTKLSEFPLASKQEVDVWKEKKKLVDDAEKALKDYTKAQANQLAEIFASRAADYLMAVAADEPGGLDKEVFERWKKYVKAEREHPFLKQWSEARTRENAERFQQLILEVSAEKKKVDEENLVRLGGSNERRVLSQANLVSLQRDKFVLWRDLFGENRGILYLDQKAIARFLTGEWKDHLDRLQAALELRRKELPPQYPFFQIITDSEKITPQKVYMRGDRNNPGDVVPRHFLTALCDGDPVPFSKGSGRMELAEAIASRTNPLTARVMVNRIWQSHFGQGLVRTPSNFGHLGDRPSHPELLDYLASRFMDSGWSIKAMHREIMLSDTYRASSKENPANAKVDAENRLLWRANRRRLDAESVRDAVLMVSGALDLNGGGKPEELDEKNRKRTVYGFVSRKTLDPMLALFDFPNPNSTSEQRVVTNVPLQGLFFLNSPLLMSQSSALAKRYEGKDPLVSVKDAYRTVLGRNPTAQEQRLGVEFVKRESWARYLQVLMSSNEFLFIG